MSCFVVQSSVTVYGGIQERGDVELPSHTLLRYKDRWSTGTHTKGMTLRLDTDAGKHRVLKGTNE